MKTITMLVAPHATSFVAISGVALFALLISPVLAFLRHGWIYRFKEITDSFTDSAIRRYYEVFHPSGKPPANLRASFDEYYRILCGHWRYVVPLAVYIVIAAIAVFWVQLSVLDLLHTGTIPSGRLPPPAVFAIAGAAMWVMGDQIARWYTSHLTPGDIYWWCFRFAIAVPMGYAFQGLFSPGIGAAGAFLLGVFPTGQLQSIAKRVAVQKLNLSDPDSGGVSELQRLNGVDFDTAQVFGTERITTVVQLAYCDPIRLTIRTGYCFGYITDCVCQALLLFYLGDQQTRDAFFKHGIRSAYEALSLWLDYKDPRTTNDAQRVIASMSAAAGASNDAMVLNLLEQVALDPNTIFLYLAWSGLEKEDLSPPRRKVLTLDEIQPTSGQAPLGQQNSANNQSSANMPSTTNNAVTVKATLINGASAPTIEVISDPSNTTGTAIYAPFATPKAPAPTDAGLAIYNECYSYAMAGVPKSGDMIEVDLNLMPITSAFTNRIEAQVIVTQIPQGGGEPVRIDDGTGDFSFPVAAGAGAGDNVVQPVIIAFS